MCAGISGWEKIATESREKKQFESISMTNRKNEKNFFDYGGRRPPL